MKKIAIYDDSFFIKKPFWMPEKLHRVVCQRANPRSKEYMQNLLSENFPNHKLISPDNITNADDVVLLYPDSIGLGWGSIERKIKNISKNIQVLNGRKRKFILNSKIQSQLNLRRLLEITFLPEIILTPFILFYSVLITIKDMIIGFKNEK